MLFVEVTQMYTGIYLCNTILVTKIFCYQYSTINNLGKNEIWQLLQEFIGGKCVKRYSYPLGFDIFIAQRPRGGPFFTGHSVITIQLNSA